jgi:mRNA-degrading endonuclease RelE of RelBE toxin-antitoxin system
MAKELIFTERFKENYQRLPMSIQERFDEKLKLFVANPRHPSLSTHRYKTEPNVWEAYITKMYRFTFSIEQESILFRNIGPHKIIDRGQV